MNNAGMGLIRKNNTRNRILHIIRTEGGLSKVAIKRKSRYSMVTVIDVLDKLENEGLISCGKALGTGRGRRPTHITINPDGGNFLGISFNAAGGAIALLDFQGNVVDFQNTHFDQTLLNAPYVLEQLKTLLLEMLSKYDKIRQKIIGLGIGSPGYVNENSGECLYYTHIKEFQNIKLLDYFSGIVPDIPVYVENNTNAMALAYRWLQPAVSDTTTVIIVIRSGVRMSLLIDSYLYRGKHFTAGEIGHIRVDGGSRYCPCGKKGCLEAEVSETAIREKILEGIRVNRFGELWKMANQCEDQVGIDLFLESVKQGHKDSLSLLDELCAFLGESVSIIVNMINPTNIYFNARLCELGDLFFSRLKAIVDDRSVFVALLDLGLRPDIFGNQSAAIGAASIVMEKELDFVDAII